VAKKEKKLVFKTLTGKAIIGVSVNKPAIVFLGLDSEGTGRESHNLLREPAKLSWVQSSARIISCKIEISENICRYIFVNEGGELEWILRTEKSSLIMEIHQKGWRPLFDLNLSLNLSQKYCPTAVLPADIEGTSPYDKVRLFAPWLFVAPDHGHLYVEIIESTAPWSSTLTGNRSDGRLFWTLACDRTFNKNDRTVFRLSMPDIAIPEGVEEKLWRQMRRPWLNLFQANADENDVETPMMLANNVLSTPAVCCTFFYSDPMLFNPYPLPGINLPLLVRRTLDDWFNNRVMQHGNVAAFAKSDTYLFTNPAFICAAWDYVKMTDDREWIEKNIHNINHIAAFILRRDQDGDGLTESIHSGNAWSLRDPDRSDFYLESINFGHKNAITNAFAYRAYYCMADLLKIAGKTQLSMVYLNAAKRMKDVYFKTFYNPQTGVLAGWISQDGQLHDYIFPFVNGLACAYGLVPEKQGREILGIIMTLLKKIKPEGWPWGIPVNLIPVPDYDLMQPNLWGGGVTETGRYKLNIAYDGIGLPRLVDPDGSLSFKGRVLYNGATQSALTTFMIMGLDRFGMTEESNWILNPLMISAVKGALQNGLHVTAGRGAEHHDWNGNPTGYEGYLPESWYFLLAILLRNKNNRRKLLFFVK